jgi:hypothetical protein
MRLHGLQLGLILIASLTLVALLPVNLIPGAEAILFHEDGIVEDASAIAYALACVLGPYALYAARMRRHHADRSVLVAITFLAIICFLDEISWGARLFKLEPPKVSDEIAFDGVHDIFMLGERWLLSLDAGSRVLLMTVALGLLAGLLFRYQKRLLALMAWLGATAARRYLACSLGLLAFAVQLDLFHGRMLTRLEDLAELTAGVLLAVAGWTSCRAARILKPDGAAPTAPSILSLPARSPDKVSLPMPKTSGYGSSPSNAPARARRHNG